MLDSVVAKQTAPLKKNSRLASEAERLGREIGELTAQAAPGGDGVQAGR